MNKIFNTALCCVLSLHLLAQDSTDCRMQVSLGMGSLALADQQIYYTYQTYNRPAYEILTQRQYQLYYPVMLHSRFNLWKFRKKAMSINLSVPATLNFYGEVSTNNTGSGKNFLLANIPYLLEYSIGRSAYCHCGPETQWGGFLAAGMNTIVGSGRIGDFDSTQPYAQLGIRGRMNQRLSLELSYGLTFSKPSRLDEVFFAEARPVSGIDYPIRKTAHAFNIGILIH